MKVIKDEKALETIFRRYKSPILVKGRFTIDAPDELFVRLTALGSRTTIDANYALNVMIAVFRIECETLVKEFFHNREIEAEVHADFEICRKDINQ